MMEIINKRHEDLRLSRRTTSMPYMRIANAKEIMFSVYATRWLGLEKGLYVHFINDDNDWFFFVNDDADGFEIQFRPAKNHSFLFNTHLVKLFLNRTNRNIGDNFFLEKTNRAKIKGCEIIKICTENPIRNPNLK